MPLYSYRCCGRSRDAFARVDDRDHGPACEGCGEPMVRQLTAPMVQVPGGVDMRYRCPMTDEVVVSGKRRKYLMEKHDVVDSREFTDTWAKAKAERAKEREEAKAAYDALPEAVKKLGTEASTAPV